MKAKQLSNLKKKSPPDLPRQGRVQICRAEVGGGDWGLAGGVKRGMSCSSRKSRCKTKHAPGVPAAPPWSPHPLRLPITDDGVGLPAVLSPSRNWAGLSCILLPWATVSHLFPSPHPSQVQTQRHIFVGRSFVQVLACCCFDPKCKLIFFFCFFVSSFVKHSICFHSPAALRSHPVSCSLGSLQLHFEFALRTFPF